MNQTIKKAFIPLVTITAGWLILCATGMAETSGESAKKPDAETLYKWGEDLLYFKYRDPYYIDAIENYRKAVEKNHPKAMLAMANALSYLMSKDDFVELYFDDLLDLLHRAEKDRKTRVYACLVHCLLESENLPEYFTRIEQRTDYAYINWAEHRLKRLIEKAARQDPESCFVMLRAAHAGRDFFGVQKKALQTLETLSAQDQPAACLYLGFLYEKGIHVPQDFHRAYQLYQQAAKKEFGIAYTRIGTLQEEGHGLSPDTAAALESYEKASLLGDYEADWRTAQMTASGEITAPGSRTAGDYYRAAAESGHIPAMYAWGVRIAEGIDGPEDIEAAYPYLIKAARSDHIDAQFYLGRLYASGRLRLAPSPDDRETSRLRRTRFRYNGFAKHWSRYWYKKASHQGHVQARTTLKEIALPIGWANIVIGLFVIPIAILALTRGQIKVRLILGSFFIIVCITFIWAGIQMVITGEPF